MSSPRPIPTLRPFNNALETLRDPSHESMRSRAAFAELLRRGGFVVEASASWERTRGFDEWAAIVADARRTDPLRTLMRALAATGQQAGVGLREEDGQLRFTHAWWFAVARRPGA